MLDFKSACQRLNPVGEDNFENRNNSCEHFRQDCQCMILKRLTLGRVACKLTVRFGALIKLLMSQSFICTEALFVTTNNYKGGGGYLPW